MTVRRWWASATGGTVSIEGVEYAVVTTQDIAEALTRAAVVLDCCGGHLNVATKRIPTGRPEEWVTVGALVEWMDMTGARARPEQDARAEEPPPAEEPEGESVLPFEDPRGVDEVGDGLYIDPDAPPDESDVLEQARA